MSPMSAIHIPCQRRQCTYHKYWKVHPSDVLGAKSAIHATSRCPSQDGLVKNEGYSGFQEDGSTPLKTASIQRLSIELLLMILAYLSPVHKTSLALTCRSLAFVLGPDAWSAGSKAKGASWRRHDEFLDLLQRDLDDKTFWRCGHCSIFHRRSQSLLEQNTKSLIKRAWSLQALSLGRKTYKEEQLEIGIRGDPIYVLSFGLVQAVMNRHHLGEAHGICLNSMKCGGICVYQPYGICNYVLKYNFTSKIVLDRLLLRSTFTFTPKRIIYVQNIRAPETPMEDFLHSSNFMFCRHESARKPILVPATNYSVKRCKYCPTQYVLEKAACDSVRFRVYQNIGAGMTASDPKWKHLVHPHGKRSERYLWGQEDLEQAFERILCSTKAEFQRQLEKSDGLGSWYDPQLKRRTYKTLPESLAETL